MENFDKFVKPIFDVAKVDSKMVATKNAKHIHEIVHAEDLSGETEKKKQRYPYSSVFKSGQMDG